MKGKIKIELNFINKYFYTTKIIKIIILFNNLN